MADSQAKNGHAVLSTISKVDRATKRLPRIEMGKSSFDVSNCVGFHLSGVRAVWVAPYCQTHLSSVQKLGRGRRSSPRFESVAMGTR